MRRILVPRAGLGALLVATAVVLSASEALAAPPLTFDVVVTAQTSTPIGAVPLSPGNSGNPNQWFYFYALTAPGSLSDSLPVQICVTASNANLDGTWPLSGQSLQLKLGPTGNGGNLTGVSEPLIPVFLMNGCTTIYIDINASGLAAGNYNKVVEVKEDSTVPQNATTHIDGKGIHVHVTVTAGTFVQCFISDSDFNYLTDCAGTPITNGNLGRFAIVVNKKNLEVATNPGQFYYNVLWTNTGATQTVRVDFTRSGVTPQGSQAIHAMVFPSLPAISSSNFALVNDGTPSGADDHLESIVVPGGYTLWVDYHLEWAGLGKVAPLGIGASCPAANQPFSVNASISDAASSVVVGSCSAGASGFKK
jgi:hypothetical protein